MKTTTYEDGVPVLRDVPLLENSLRARVMWMSAMN